MRRGGADSYVEFGRVEGPVGFQPPTPGLKVRSSTAELRARDAPKIVAVCGLLQQVTGSPLVFPCGQLAAEPINGSETGLARAEATANYSEALFFLLMGLLSSFSSCWFV